MNNEEIELGSDSEDDNQIANGNNVDGQNNDNMTPAQRKLFELRLKMNSARKANHQEVIEENKRKHADPREEARLKAAEHKKKEEQLRKEAEERGLDPESAKLLNTTIAKSERVSGGKKKKYFDWDVFNDDSQHRSYKKSLKQLPKSKRAATNNEGEAETSAVSQQVLAPNEALTASDALLSNEHVPRDQAVNRLVDALHVRAVKRQKFSRHRPEHPDADIDYINNRNKEFNKKISRHFDQYTTEIKQSLERGTAI